MTKVTSQGFSKSCSYKQTLNLHNNSYCSALRYRSSLIAMEWARRRKRRTYSYYHHPILFPPWPAARREGAASALRCQAAKPGLWLRVTRPSRHPQRCRSPGSVPGQGDAVTRPRLPAAPGAVQGPAPTPPPAGPAAPRGAFVTSCFWKTLSQPSPFITVQQHILPVFLYLQRDSSPLLRYPRVLLKFIPKHIHWNASSAFTWQDTSSLLLGEF